MKPVRSQGGGQSCVSSWFLGDMAIELAYEKCSVDCPKEGTEMDREPATCLPFTRKVTGVTRYLGYDPGARARGGPGSVDLQFLPRQ